MESDLMLMMKRVLSAVLSVVLILSLAACGEKAADGFKTEQVDYDAVLLTEEEKGILEAMGSDVNVVSDESYVSTVSELIYHTADYVGSVYQLEGVISVDGENVSVYRTLVNGDETQQLGLPLRYMEKEIVDGAWVRVTGVIASGENGTVLDVVAIEAPEEYGQTEFQWDGSDVHQHE